MSGAAAFRQGESEEASRRDFSLKPKEAADDSIASHRDKAAHWFSWSRQRRKNSVCSVYSVVPFTHYSSLPLLITHYSSLPLPIPHYSLLITHYPKPFRGRAKGAVAYTVKEVERSKSGSWQRRD